MSKMSKNRSTSSRAPSRPTSRVTSTDIEKKKIAMAARGLPEMNGDPLSDAMAGVLYLTTNSDKAEVKELAKKAKIDLSGFSGPVGPSFEDFSNSIKALVCMGLDTDENLNLMFGSAKCVRSLQQEIRMGVLFDGSSSDLGGSSIASKTNPNKPASMDIMKLLSKWQRTLTRSEQDDHCAICEKKLVSPVQALHGCMHLFHPNCAMDWLKQKSNCPVCKTALPLYAPRPPSTQELELIDQMSTLK